MNSFLNRERVKVYPRIFITLYLLIGIIWVLAGSGLTDPLGKPIGCDFIGFYSASILAMEGDPANAYNLNKIKEIQKEIIGKEIPVFAWNYPPTFLLMITPLSFMPYLMSLILWLIIPLSCYLFMVRRIAPHPATMWLFLAFPGIFINITNGQNGIFSASLLGAGLLLMEHHPYIAGFFLGLLSYKPHLAILIPVALLASRKWKILISISITMSCLIFISIIALGIDPWISFWRNIPFTTYLLEHGTIYWFKMPTIFAAVRLIGGSLSLARILQTMVMLIIFLSIGWIWSRETPHELSASALVLGGILATPYAFDYDLAILGLPLAWISWDVYKKKWLHQGQIILLLVWLSPLITPLIAKITNLQICPFILITLFIFILKRIKLEHKILYKKVCPKTIIGVPDIPENEKIIQKPV